MESLPLEMRMMIYEILDYPSILQMRVVNSWLRDDIDANVGFRLSIKTSLIPTRSQTIKPMFLKKIQSVKFVSNANDPEPKPMHVIHGWKGKPFVFKYPLFVKNLEFGSFTQDTRPCLTQSGFLNLLKDCQNLEKLVISQFKFHGQTLNRNQVVQLENIIQSFKRLRTLRLKFTPQGNTITSSHDLSASSLISSIIRNCQSSKLTTFELDLYAFGDVLTSSDPSKIDPLLFYPLITAFKLASKHWRTLKTLNLKVNNENVTFRVLANLPMVEVLLSMNDDSWKVFLEDFKRITNLTELRFLHFNDDDDNIGRHTELEFNLSLDLVLQQRYLRELHFRLPTPIKFETLKQTVQHNSASLRNISVANVLRSSDINENILDMDIFHSCVQLETIDIDFVDSQMSRDFRIINLRSLPSQLKNLTLLGLIIPDDSQQLLEFSDNPINLKHIEFGFYPFQSTSDLILIITNFVRNFSGLETIHLKIVNPYFRDPVVEGDARTWEMEYSRLIALFTLFSSHKILDKAGPWSSWPYYYESYHKLTANTITSEDRTRILEYVQGN